jgi:hypothetical protein
MAKVFSTPFQETAPNKIATAKLRTERLSRSREPIVVLLVGWDSADVSALAMSGSSINY